MYHISMTLYPIYQFQAKDWLSGEFMHLNWIFPSYYSSPKHKEPASLIFDILLSLLYTVI